MNDEQLQTLISAIAAPEKLDWKRRVERHLHSVALLIIIGICGAAGTMLLNVDKGQAVLSTKMDSLEVQLSTMYRKADADRDRADTAKDIGEINRKIETNSAAIADLRSKSK